MCQPTDRAACDHIHVVKTDMLPHEASIDTISACGQAEYHVDVCEGDIEQEEEFLTFLALLNDEQRPDSTSRSTAAVPNSAEDACEQQSKPVDECDHNLLLNMRVQFFPVFAAWPCCWRVSIARGRKMFQGLKGDLDVQLTERRQSTSFQSGAVRALVHLCYLV